MRQRVSPREHLRRGNAVSILIVARHHPDCRATRIIWRTERDHLLSSPRKAGTQLDLDPRFREDENRRRSVTVN
jgi:hypothetical protein